ncbi:TSCPD domain-containing protein [Acidisoma sp. 7E03]
MRTSKAWAGIRLTWVEAAPDPDSETIPVLLPTSWGVQAASALAALAPAGARRVSLAERADAWITRAAERAAAAGVATEAAFGRALHDMVIRRRGAPGAALWRDAAVATAGIPRFVLNLPAFHDAESGFDHEAFGDAAETAALTLALLRPGARRIAVGFADLDGLLALLGLDYASPAARDVAVAIAAVLRGRAECASARLSDAAGPQILPDVWSAPVMGLAPAGLAGAAEAAFHAAAGLPGCAHDMVAALTPADEAEVLLGVETTGYAPAFARVSPEGGLTRAARGLLAARGLSAEAALAAQLAGETPLAVAGPTAQAAMHAALAPILPLPAPAAQSLRRRGETPAAAPVSPVPAVPVELPRRRSGTMQKVTVGGHRLYLQTADYADGRLGEIGITLQRETPAYRALMEAFATAVSIALQHGVPLEPFVDAFVGSRFGVAGPVEGDPAVRSATSIIDYVFRHLAHAQLGQSLPEPEEIAATAAQMARDDEPTLPLDWPEETPEARRRRIRLVA